MKKPTAVFVKGIRGTDELFQDALPHIAFVGRSNVGKSSLINALVERRELARAGKKPGKTREINIFSINNAQYLVDLPGYGYAEGSRVERESLKDLIVWYLSASHAPISLVVLIIDAVAGLTALDRDMLTVLNGENHPYIVVINKIDKLSQKDLHMREAAVKELIGEHEVYRCSTLEGKGLEALRKRVLP
jgi:GTP-binding protein